MSVKAPVSEGSTQNSASRAWGAWEKIYILHLAVPALLVVDILTARVRHEIVLRPFTPVSAVLAISAFWLAAGLWVFRLTRRRPSLIERTYAPLLSIYTIFGMLILAESVVRIIGIAPVVPAAQQPGRRVTKWSPDLGPGMGGIKTFTINKLGLRGPMPPARGAYRILAIGASATLGAELDDSEEWPHVLMEDLNASSKLPVWVGNESTGGRNSVDYLVQLQVLPEIVHFDMAVFLIGGNDLQATLAYEGGATESDLEKAAGFKGELPRGTRSRPLPVPPPVYPYYRRLRLFLAIHNATGNAQAKLASLADADGEQRSGGLPLPALRKKRAASPVVPLPSLSTGLSEYRVRLIRLANQCHNAQIRCLFLTEPALLRDDLSPEEQKLLWGGWIGKRESSRGFLSVPDMKRAVDSYNQTLLDVCRQYGMECFDLASHVPHDTTVLYDDMHFNPAGARTVARVLAQYLAATPPFSGG
jgi:lysophospholipase L1-like esterase